MAQQGPMMAPPAGSTMTPADPAQPMAPAADGQPQQSISYKKDVESAITSATQKPVAPRRLTTYRPEGVANTMPVLSPDQYRRPQR